MSVSTTNVGGPFIPTGGGGGGGGVPDTRIIAAGTGLTGGGDLTTDRTIAMPAVGTAGTYGGAGNIVESVTTDSRGRVSGVTTTSRTSGLVPDSRTVSAGTGLSGGGDLSANRTISMPNTGPGAGAIGGGANYVNSITLDAQGRVTAATTGAPGGGTSWPIANDPEGAEKNRAATVLGAAVSGAFIPFIGGLPGGTTLGGSATVTHSAGYIRLSNNPAGASSAYHYWKSNSSVNNAVPSGTGGEWYISCRMRCDGTLASPARAVFGLGNAATDRLWTGFDFGISTTHFVTKCFDGAAASIVSTVAIDNNWHTFRLYRVGGTTTLEIDGSAVGTSADVFPAGTQALTSLAYATGAATAFHTDMAWQTVFVKQP